MQQTCMLEKLKPECVRAQARRAGDRCETLPPPGLSAGAIWNICRLWAWSGGVLQTCVSLSDLPAARALTRMP